MAERGCGFREKGGLYLCCGSSPWGMPVEHFVVDPPVSWRGPRILRAPMLVERGGIHHVIMTVGARYYPYVPDFIEEVRVMGLSKQIPRDFDLSKLTPGGSTIILVHSRAIPAFPFNAEWECRKPCSRCRKLEVAACRPGHRLGSPRCTFALWPLSQLKTHKRVHEVEKLEGGVARIKTPSTTYTVGSAAPLGRPKYRPGIFARFYITDIEYVGDRVPRDIQKRAGKAGWRVKPCRE